MRKQIIGMTIGLALAGVAAGAAQAGTIPYPNAGTQNPITYTFQAAATGPINAYFAGSSAGFEEVVGLLVNGVSTNITGLDNHTSVLGQMFFLGNAQANDFLTFEVIILPPNQNVGPWFSNPALNSDGANHVYSTSAVANQISPLVPAGIYVAFEDLPKGSSDFDYNDVSFVFTNVARGVPEPSTWAMMLIGFAGLGFSAHRRRRETKLA
jgi:hypothetical protein